MQPHPASKHSIATGDRVRLRKDGAGTVVAVIDEQPAGGPPALHQWRRLGRGIVVRLDTGALVHIREPLFELVAADDAPAAGGDPPPATGAAPPHGRR